MNFLGQAAARQMGMGMPMAGMPMAVKRPMSGGMGAPAMKRPKIETSTGDAKLDKLVMRIKNYQRGDPSQKQQWWEYADQYLDGVRDPAKHDVATLKGFCES